MKSAPYSNDYSPPAPVLQVSLAVLEETPKLGSFAALVDTGADGSFVPTTLLEELEIPVAYMTNVRSHVGDRTHRVSVHKVDLILFNTIRLPGIEVVSDDWNEQIILGRNVLNRLELHLDGPHQLANVQE